MRFSVRSFAIAAVLSAMTVPVWGQNPAYDETTAPPSTKAPEKPAAKAPAETPAPAAPCATAPAQSPVAPAQPAVTQCSACQIAPACQSPFDGDCCERPYLLGSLCGLRDELGCHGIEFNANTYQYYQGVVSGGINPGYEYAGRFDYFANVNGAKAGLWEGFFINIHGETRYGEDVNTDTGAIIPVNTGTLFPIPKGDETALTGVKFTQALSEDFAVFAGKLNMLDSLKMPFTGASALDGFWNLGMSFPAIVARTVPYSTLGAGAVVLNEGTPVLTVMALDTNNTPTESGFETFFDNGATVFGNLMLPTNFFNLPGHQGLSGTYSSGDYNDLSPNPYFDPTAGLVIVPQFEQGSYSVFYSADQALYVNPNNPKRMWGVFTNIGTADNGPSPIRFAANVGLYGSSPINNRPLDTWGVGYAYTRYSSPIRDLAPVLLPIGEDQVVELFYNIGVTPWFHVCPDVQFVLPARERTLPPNARDIDNAVVLGLRAKVDF